MVKTLIIAFAICALTVTAALSWFPHGVGTTFVADSANAILTNDPGTNDLLAQ